MDDILRQRVRAALAGVIMLLVGAALSSLASLMFGFMGGDSNAVDLGALIALQLVAAAVALATIVGGGAFSVGALGSGAGLRTLWLHTPQWLVFVAIVLGSLSLFGEVAYIIAGRATDYVSHWKDHVPLATLFLAAIALCVSVALRSILARQQPPPSGRWP